MDRIAHDRYLERGHGGPCISGLFDDRVADQAAELLGNPDQVIDLLQEVVFDLAGRARGTGAEPQHEDGDFNPDAPAADLFVAVFSDSSTHAEAARLELARRLLVAAEERAAERLMDDAR